MNVRVLAVCLLMLLMGGCAAPTKRADEYAAQEEWMKVVLEYRKLHSAKPGDVEYNSRLKQAELKAADFYYQRGIRFLEQGNLDGAIIEYQQGLAAKPEHAKLQQAMNTVLARKEADMLAREGMAHQEAGNHAVARRQFEKALQVYPEHTESLSVLAEIQKTEAENNIEGLVLSSNAPIMLNFRQTDLRQAFEFIAKSFGINVIFDDGIKSTPVTLFAKDVTFEQAIGLVLTTTKSFYRRLGQNTILVAPDTKEKRNQYQDYLVRTFNLSNIKAKDMSDIVKGVISVNKIIINEELNSLVVRDTDDVISLVEKMIFINDRKPAEIMMEVEILEVNRSKAEKLGLDLGSYAATIGVPPELPRGTSPQDVYTLTVPSATFRFFKQDVDAKTLANPKVRVINGKLAKIHIGDRVPLRASTIVEATGQTRTTYDYKDVGIRLSVEPMIHLDNSSSVKLGLEVSSLGENLGTSSEPAYRIGTRNAETYMLLRDGETAILGGLIRDEERDTRVKVPGFGDIPVVGSLFTSYDDSGGRTDVLLTITPRVVRSWDLPARPTREFYSGTETVYSTKPLFAYLEDHVGNEQQINTGSRHMADVSPLPTLETKSVDTPNSPVTKEPVRATVPPYLAFSDAVYELETGRDGSVTIIGGNFEGVHVLPIEILYNPQLISFIDGEKNPDKVNSISTSADPDRGVIRVNIDIMAGVNFQEATSLANLKLKGLKPGISYLVYRTPEIRNSAGEVVDAQVRTTRVIVK